MLTKQVAVIGTERNEWIERQASRFCCTVWHGLMRDLRMSQQSLAHWHGKIGNATAHVGTLAEYHHITPAIRCSMGVTQIGSVSDDATVFLRDDEWMQRFLKGKWNPFVSDVIFADGGMQCLAITVEYDESQWVIIGHDGQTLARWEKPKPPKSSKRFHPVVWSGSE